MYITLYYIHCAQADLVWAACCVALLALKCEGRLAPGGVGWKAEGETDKILTYHDFEGKTHTQSSPVIYHDVSLKVAIWMQTLRSLRLTLLAEAPHTPPVYWNLELGSIGKLQIRDIQGGSKPGNSDLLSLFSFIFKLIYGLWIIGGHWWCIYWYTMTTCIDHWFYDSGFIDHRSSCRRLQRSAKWLKWVCPIPWWPRVFMATRA